MLMLAGLRRAVRELGHSIDMKSRLRQVLLMIWPACSYCPADASLRTGFQPERKLLYGFEAQCHATRLTRIADGAACLQVARLENRLIDISLDIKLHKLYCSRMVMCVILIWQCNMLFRLIKAWQSC